MKTQQPGLSHLALDMRDIAPPRLGVTMAVRQTIDQIGYRAAIFDLVCNLCGGLSAVAKQGDEFTIALGDDCTVTIRMPFPGCDLGQKSVREMIEELTREPETTREEAHSAFCESAAGLVMEAAVRSGRDPGEVCDEIIRDVQRDHARRNQNLN